MDLLNDHQELLGVDQVQICEEMGESYQQQASDRLLVKTHAACYEAVYTHHKRDVGPFLPTITQDLLKGDFGTPDLEGFTTEGEHAQEVSAKNCRPHFVEEGDQGGELP